MGSLDYQEWFLKHYPILYNEVEAAYTEWIVYGYKNFVEMYKAHVGGESPRAMLEEARKILKSSKMVSTNEGQAIYSVTFEPSDFYKYLTPP